MGSLFSGIGGLDLGLEWGIKDAETVWQIEMEPFGRSILERHWPDADRSVTDVRKGNAENLAPVDLISGGFPCQDISVAGNQKGFSGEKSSLFYELSRIVAELRPRFIVLENVSAITSPNMRPVLSNVLSTVSALGYNGEWHRVSAAQVGAPHLRNRWFFIGWLPSDADSNREPACAIDAETRVLSKMAANADDSTDAPVRGKRENVPRESDCGRNDRSGSGINAERKKPVRETRIDPCNDVANAESIGPGESRHVDQKERTTRSNTTQSNRSGSDVANAERQRRQRSRQHDAPLNPATKSQRKADQSIASTNHPWSVEPPVGRVVNGLSKRLSRRNRHALRALGNAVVPQCAELVGRRVQEIREILDNE